MKRQSMDFDFDSGNISAGGSTDDFLRSSTGRQAGAPHIIYAAVIILLLIFSFVFDRIDIWFGM